MSWNARAAALVALLALAILAVQLAAEPHQAKNAMTTSRAQVGSRAQVDEAAWARVSEAYRALPLSFAPNLGQTDPRVKFLARAQGLTLFLTSTDAVLVTREAAVRMRLLGARPDSDARGLDELPGRTSSFIGRDPRRWRVGAPTYARVRYRDVYPGIDLVYYGAWMKRLEYDFVVAPGVDPRAIRLAFEGVDRLELNADGDLVLHVGDAGLRFGKPRVYQDVGVARREISGRWVLDGAFTAGFQLAAYDVSRPLVIDPVVNLATYVGGGGTDQAFAIAVDASSNVYLTGNTTSTNFPTTVGAFDSTCGSDGTCDGGLSDAFVVKLNSTLSAPVYSTYLGGSGTDAGRDIVVDSSGNAYVTGFTNSSDFPTSLGAFQTTCGGGAPCNNDAFVVKLDGTGARDYGTYLGGADSDVGLGITVDSSGNAYVTGGTFSADFPTTAGAAQTTLGGGRDAFVTKLNATGTAPLTYSTYLGGSGDDVGNAIVVDSAGAAYVTGSTNSIDFPTLGAFQTTIGSVDGATDAFVTKIKADGSAKVYSTYLGGSKSDEGLDITVDSSGDAYITGATSSGNFPKTGTFTFSGTTTQAFLTELNPAGTSLVVSRPVPTGKLDTADRDPAGPDISVSIARDTAGNIYVAGSELRSGVPVNSDAFVVSLDPTVTSTNTIFVGGTGDDFGLNLAVDAAAGTVLLTGDTASTDFPTTAGVFGPTCGSDGTCDGGLSDAFVAQIGGLNVFPSAEGSDKGGGPCFIATAAFGSPLAREVGVLREFRDRVLLPHRAGRVVVAAYYRASPPLARVVARYAALKGLVSTGLRPIVWIASRLLGLPALAFSLVVIAGSLIAAALVILALARYAGTARRRAIVATLVAALALAAGITVLDRPDHRRFESPEAPMRHRAGPDVSGVAPGLARERQVEARAGTPVAVLPSVEIRRLGPDSYDVDLRGSLGRLPALGRFVAVRPTFSGYLVESEIGAGILTADGLSVTDPKVSASVGIEPGDKILAVNGHSVVGGLFLTLVKLRRDPDSGTVRLEVDRGGTRIQRTLVIH